MIFDFCLRKAAKFTSLGQWALKDNPSYQLALKRGFHRTIAEIYDWTVGKRVTDKYNFKECLTNAKQYKTRKAWYEKDKEYFLTATRNDWVTPIAKELGWGVPYKWKYKKCLEYAQKFVSSAEWCQSKHPSYFTASHRGWLEIIKNELGWPVTPWDYERCKAKAALCTSLAGWDEYHQTSYVYATQSGWQRKIAKELGWVCRGTGIRNEWTYEQCVAQATNFTYLTEWTRNHRATFDYAKRKGWHLKIVEELGWVYRKVKIWDYRACLLTTEGVVSFTVWQVSHRNAYRAAKRKGFLDKILEANKWVKAFAVPKA